MLAARPSACVRPEEPARERGWGAGDDGYWFLDLKGFAVADLLNGLGGVAGFGAFELAPGDEDSQFVDISGVYPGGLNFFGTTYTGFFINTNGNITFDEGNFGTSMGAIDANTPAGLYPFWADVDNFGGPSTPTPGGTSTGSNQIYYDLDANTGRIVITWDDVGFYDGNTSKLNAFQIIIEDASGAPGGAPGDFSFEFRYENIDWTSGDFDGGTDGLGGIPARAGYSAGDGSVNFFELPQSGNESALLNLETAQAPFVFLSTAGGVSELTAVDDSFFVPQGFGPGSSTFGESFNVLNNDVDPDGGVLTATAQTGVAGDNGGVFTIAADGTLTFDTNGDFDALASGDVIETSITYTVSDEGGDTDTATATLAVIGTDGAATAGDDLLETVPTGATLNALQGDDIIFGGSESSFINAGGGEDGIDAGAGDDIIEGRNGNDLIFGGAGRDVFRYIDANEGSDRIGDFTQGEDVIDVKLANIAALTDLAIDTTTVPGSTVVEFGNTQILLENFTGTLTENDFRFVGSGTEGADILSGNSADNVFSGLGGDDRILGRSGSDDLAGDAGADFLAGGRGNDRLDGGAENDTLIGGQDTDILIGSTGNDVLISIAGEDTLTGGVDGSTAANSDGERDLFSIKASGARTVTITDFEGGIDKLNLRALSVTTLAEISQSDDGADLIMTFDNDATQIRLNGLAGSLISDDDIMI